MRSGLLLTVWAVVGCTGEAPTTCGEVQCPGGGVLAAEISEQTLPTCSDVEQRYADVVSAGLACTCDDDCRVLVGQCSVGLGGCYEAGGTCAEQGLLDQLAGLYRSHSEGCTGAACDCGEAPPVRCVASRCVLDAR